MRRLLVGEHVQEDGDCVTFAHVTGGAVMVVVLLLRCADVVLLRSRREVRSRVRRGASKREK